MMHRMFSTLTETERVARRVRWPAAAVVLALTLVGCENTSEPTPETGTDYYPIAVGNYWLYAVADTTWSLGTQTMLSVPTVSTYQFRESITEKFKDAAGHDAYRLVRAKRVPPATTWRDDSVFVLSPTPQAVVLNRNNARTVELIFPVRDGRTWNFNAFNNNSNDTITAETRRYSRVGEAFSTGSSGQPNQTFPTTLTTLNTGKAAIDNELGNLSYQQVFAKGVGPILRHRRQFDRLNYTDIASGNQVYVRGSYTRASVRRETLLDYSLR